MSGQATHLGSLTLGQCVPMALTAVAELSAAASLALPQISGKIEGAALTIGVPDLAGLIRAAIALEKQLEALLTSGGPTIGLQVGAVASLLAELNGSLGSINATMSLAATLTAVLGTPGIEAYRYDGTAGSFTTAFAPEFDGGLRIGGGPNLPIHAIVLVATDSGAWAMMQRVLAS